MTLIKINNFYQALEEKDSSIYWYSEQELPEITKSTFKVYLQTLQKNDEC